MPSFPTSVFAPASRSAGQTIQPAHMNDVQDELNAIEGGYLNGTARLNSSGSTLASLDVNGNSTLASSVTLGSIPYIMPSSGGSTGNILTCISTSGSTMTLEWRAAASPDAARVQLDALQELAVGGSSVLWSSQVFVTNSSMHSTATNPARLTPQSTGIYLAVVGVSVRSVGSTYEITIKDSTGSNVGYVRAVSTASDAGFNLSAMKRFDVLGGYLTVTVENAGTTNAVRAGNDSFFSMVKL